jgi:diadenosine tetraphosphate (Ap4A) HIT family hydrolase
MFALIGRARSRPAPPSLQGWRMFAHHPAFDAGSVRLAVLPLCDVRLQDDARFPWLILIPRIDGASGLEDVPAEDHARLMAEAMRAGRGVRAIGVARGRPVLRLNLAALGNLTPQLHLHIVGRRADDAAWPGPVWGFGEATPYDAEALACAQAAALAAIGSG